MSKFRVRKTDDRCNTWTVADGPGYISSRDYIQSNGTVGNCCAAYLTEVAAQVALDLYLKSQQRTFVGHPDRGLEIRTFDTGATRDTVQGKLDYVKALSPIVLRRYVQYLDKHRLQSDGSYRDFDNWKKGMPQETYRSSNGRHFFDDWLLSEGYTTEDNHGPIVDIEDVICAKIFNDMGRLKEILEARFKEEAKVDRTTPTPGGY